MIEIDVDVSMLTIAERRMLSSFVALLDAKVDGVLRVHENNNAVPAAKLWKLQPSTVHTSTLELMSPTGALRAKITRPLVIGALKRMMAEARQTSVEPDAAKRSAQQTIQERASHLQKPLLSSGKSTMQTSGNPTVVRQKIEPITPVEHTDPHQFIGIVDLAPLVDALRQGGDGIFELRFPDGAAIRIDRGSNTFRCKNMQRAQLFERILRGHPRWSQLRQVSKNKSDETQASMAPLLFALGAASAKEKFIAGQHTELEFKISAAVGYGKFGDFARIAEAFSEFSPVPDAAVKLSTAPVEILACLNGYAAIGLLETRARSANKAQTVSKSNEVQAPGLLARIKSSFGVKS